MELLGLLQYITTYQGFITPEEISIIISNSDLELNLRLREVYAVISTRLAIRRLEQNQSETGRELRNHLISHLQMVVKSHFINIKKGKSRKISPLHLCYRSYLECIYRNVADLVVQLSWSPHRRIVEDSYRINGRLLHGPINDRDLEILEQLSSELNYALSMGEPFVSPISNVMLPQMKEELLRALRGEKLTEFNLDKFVRLLNWLGSMTCSRETTMYHPSTALRDAFGMDCFFLASIIAFANTNREAVDPHIFELLEKIYKSLLKFIALRFNNPEFRTSMRRSLHCASLGDHLLRELEDRSFFDQPYTYDYDSLGICLRSMRSMRHCLSDQIELVELIETSAMNFLYRALRELIPIVSGCFFMSMIVRNPPPELLGCRGLVECAREDALLPFIHWDAQRIGDLLTVVAELLERAVASGDMNFFANPSVVVLTNSRGNTIPLARLVAARSRHGYVVIAMEDPASVELVRRVMPPGRAITAAEVEAMAREIAREAARREAEQTWIERQLDPTLDIGNLVAQIVGGIRGLMQRALGGSSATSSSTTTSDSTTSENITGRSNSGQLPPHDLRFHTN